jgi:ribose transport system permease protein
MGARIRFNPRLDKLSGLYLWALFIIVFAIWIPRLFLSSATAHTIAMSQAVNGILAISILIPLAAGVFDLSIGATANLTGILAVILQTEHGWGIAQSVIAGVLCGALIGVVNGFLVVKLHISSFIATLGTSTIIAAIQAILTGSVQPDAPQASAWATLTQQTIFGYQIIVLYLIIIAVFVWWFLTRTPAGRYLYAIGGNAEAARLSGVQVDGWVWFSLICSGTMCGLAGVLYTSQTGPALTFGNSLLLPAFAAAFLGSTQITPGRFNVWGTLIAVYALATGVTGLQLVTGVQWLSDMFNGIALIAAVAFAIWRQRTRLAPRRRKSPANRHMTPSSTEALSQQSRQADTETNLA